MDSRALLAALQHADSFFPSGTVSFSWGLEALRADGLVRTAEDVTQFIAALLRHRWATGDRPILAAAHATGDDLEAVRCPTQKPCAATGSATSRSRPMPRHNRPCITATWPGARSASTQAR
jgi:urease accessory protein UreF